MKRLTLLACALLCAVCSIHAQTWGINNTRTETRDDAGASGPGIKSGFYQTTNPINYPSGATGWWHLLDIRQSDTNINFAMQFAGSLFDRHLYFRKTINDGSNVWNRVLMEEGSSSDDPDTTRLSFSKFAGGGWINLPTTGPSGIGSNGAGQNAWIGYAAQPNMWFPYTNTGDICYRNIHGRMLFGSSAYEAAVMAITGNKIGIGTSTPNEVLSVVGNIADSGNLIVSGNIIGKKLKITQTPWADFVFDQDYKLPTLDEIYQHIQAHHRLPGVPSADEVAQNGVDVGETQALLLQKIEELTLHLLDQNKSLDNLRSEVQRLKQKRRNRN